MKDLHDLFSEDEAVALARTRAEMAEEQKAYDALPQVEKDLLTAQRDALWADDEDSETATCWICGCEIDMCDDDGSEICPDCADGYEDEENGY